jgi:hypothetical protein
MIEFSYPTGCLVTLAGPYAAGELEKLAESMKWETG